MNSKCPVCESNNIKKFNLYHVFFFKENYHSVCLNCTMVFCQPKKKYYISMVNIEKVKIIYFKIIFLIPGQLLAT
jgi:hypothetical protein